MVDVGFYISERKVFYKNIWRATYRTNKCSFAKIVKKKELLSIFVMNELMNGASISQKKSFQMMK